jgi:YEATS domain-containing protein 4
MTVLRLQPAVIPSTKAIIVNNLAIEAPPFQVTETGWGEFEIQIKVHFVPEASEKPMTLFHFLHLHPYGPNKDEERDQGATVEAFQYEEIVSLCLN